MEIKRGDIYYADLSPVIGCEQGSVRPVLIVQNDVGNHYSPTVIVAAITSRRKKKIPTHVLLDGYKSGIRSHSLIMLEQIRTIDRARLMRYMGRLDEDAMQNVDEAIAVSFGLNKTQSRNCCLCPVGAEKNSGF